MLTRRRLAAESCRACGHHETRRKKVVQRAKGRSVVAVICERCGHVALPGNAHDYTQMSADALPLKPRVGTENRTGREFGMAKLAVDVLGRTDLSVLVYGAGRSLDNEHIARLPQVSKVAIGDVMRTRADADFIDLTEPPSRRFDIVIACEVIEHFLFPREDFPRLLAYLEPNGLLVCSTNIYDGSDMSQHAYPFSHGHTSYYTPAALRAIAAENHVCLDFRVPKAAAAAGPRKRYVLISRERAVADAVNDYFGSHQYAPSESARARKRRQKRQQRRRHPAH